MFGLKAFKKAKAKKYSKVKNNELTIANKKSSNKTPLIKKQYSKNNVLAKTNNRVSSSTFNSKNSKTKSTSQEYKKRP